MAELDSYFKSIEALDSAPSNPEQAAELLRIAARCIRAGEALPLGLDRHIAEAFERAAAAPHGDKREQALLHGLLLRASGRRPPSPVLVKRAIWLMIDLHARKKNWSPNELAEWTIRSLRKDGIDDVPVSATIVSWYRDFLGEDRWRKEFSSTSRMSERGNKRR